MCVITAGWGAAPCDAGQVAPGIAEDSLYAANYSEMTTYTPVSGKNEISGITFAATKGTFAIPLYEDSVEMTSIKNENGGYEVTVTGRMMNSDSTTEQAVADMTNAKLIMIAKEKSGTYRVAGLEGGLKLVQNDYNTGKTLGDERGRLIMWKATQNYEPKQYFDTDTSTTQSEIEGYVI